MLADGVPRPWEVPVLVRGPVPSVRMKLADGPATFRNLDVME
jgi:hypothetical protein